MSRAAPSPQPPPARGGGVLVRHQYSPSPCGRGSGGGGPAPDHHRHHPVQPRPARRTGRPGPPEPPPRRHRSPRQCQLHRPRRPDLRTGPRRRPADPRPPRPDRRRCAGFDRPDRSRLHGAVRHPRHPARPLGRAFRAPPRLPRPGLAHPRSAWRRARRHPLHRADQPVHDAGRPDLAPGRWHRGRQRRPRLARRPLAHHRDTALSRRILRPGADRLPDPGPRSRRSAASSSGLRPARWRR